jgi:hypothetical protein
MFFLFRLFMQPMEGAAAAAKRIYRELMRIHTYNSTNPTSIKFILDETPFSDGENPFCDDDTRPARIVSTTDMGGCFFVIGRILPASNIFNQSAFKIELKIPIGYPFNPPVVRMLTPIYHPNFGPEGK